MSQTKCSDSPGGTHHLACPCYEAERAAEIARLRDALATLDAALEACEGGDLASGEGIYKAEIARDARAAAAAILKGGA